MFSSDITQLSGNYLNWYFIYLLIELFPHSKYYEIYFNLPEAAEQNIFPKKKLFFPSSYLDNCL